MGTGSKVELARGTRANIAMASDLAKEAGVASTAGPNRTCSNGRSGKDKCGDSNLSTEGRVSSKEPICYGHG